MKRKLRIAYMIGFILLLITEVFIALFVNEHFVRPYVGDMLVTVLICCCGRIFIPDKLPALPVFVFLFAAAVEIGQYFDIVKLLGLDGNRLISTILGRTFSFADLVCYAIGCIVFAGIQKLVSTYCNTR